MILWRKGGNKMKLSEELIKKVEEITMTDYGFENGKTENGDILVEDLVREYESLLDEYNDYKEKMLDDGRDIPLF